MINAVIEGLSRGLGALGGLGLTQIFWKASWKTDPRLDFNDLIKVIQASLAQDPAST